LVVRPGPSDFPTHQVVLSTRRSAIKPAPAARLTGFALTKAAHATYKRRGTADR
jgi:hypothetical protein